MSVPSRLRLGLTLLTLVACGGTADEQGTCTPGNTVDCTCADGAVGQRVCIADGSDYGGCVCADVLTPDTTGDAHEVIDTTPATGSLEAIVHDDSEGAFAFQNLLVRLLPGATTCASLNPTRPPAGVLAQKVLVTTGTSALFENLPAAQTYTLFVTAKGPNNHLAGVGCEEGVSLVGGQVTKHSVYIQVLPLEPFGCYNSAYELTLAASAASAATHVKDTADELLGGLDAALVTGVVQRLKDAHGEAWGAALVDQIVEGFEAELEGSLEAWLPEHPRAWLDCLLRLTDDLVGIASLVTASVRIRLEAPDDTGALTGREDWLTLSVVWPAACDAAGVCPAIERAVSGCARQTGTNRCVCQLPLADVAVGTQAALTGAVHDWDQLTIASHTTPLRPARLATRALRLLLVASSGAQHQGFDTAIPALWDCAALAAPIDPTLYNITGIAPADVAAACTAEASALAQAFALAVDDQVESEIALEGATTLLDVNDDLAIDQLKFGTWEGSIRVGDHLGAVFEGTFTGNRTTCPPN